MKKSSLIILAIIALSTSCKKKYQEGFNAGLVDGKVQGRVDGYNGGYADGQTDGHAEGYEAGYAESNPIGYQAGYAEGEVYYTNAGYDEGIIDGGNAGSVDGYNDGYNLGYDTGYDQQYGVGYGHGDRDGFDDGFSSGYTSGYNRGRTNGYNTGYDRGYDSAYDSGYHSGYYSSSSGYDDGYEDGYDNGYGDGYDDGSYDSSYGYSVKSNNPSVKLASMLNRDLIDYAKLKDFKSNEQTGFILSHADAGTVDMEKLATLKEQHFLNEMSYQLRAKFGLNAERSKEIAVIAHQFNKTAGMRELTEKDAQVFAKEVIGTDLNTIQDAVTKSFKGDSALLDKMLVSIAGHNQTSPETVNRIIMEIFF